MDNTITIDQFAAVDLRVGNIISADTIEGSEKLFNLTIDIGESEPRTVLSGIRPYYKTEDLVGRKCAVVANLQPRAMMGIESDGMLVCVTYQKDEGDERGEWVEIIEPSKDAPVGSRLS